MIRFDYTIELTGRKQALHTYVNSMNDVFYMTRGYGFDVDTKTINGLIVSIGAAEFNRFGVNIKITRTPKPTPEELASKFVDGTDEEKLFVLKYLQRNKGLIRKVNPAIRKVSKAKKPEIIRAEDVDAYNLDDEPTGESNTDASL